MEAALFPEATILHWARGESGSYVNRDTGAQVPRLRARVPRAARPTHFRWHYMSKRYLSNMTSFVFYGITCLMRLIEMATLFTTFEEHMC